MVPSAVGSSTDGGSSMADSTDKKTPRKKFLSLSRSSKIEHEPHEAAVPSPTVAAAAAAAAAPDAEASAAGAEASAAEADMPSGQKAALKLALLAAALGGTPDDHTTTPDAAHTPVDAASHGSARELPVEHTSGSGSLSSSSSSKLHASADAAGSATATPTTPSATAEADERAPSLQGAVHTTDSSPSLSHSSGSSSSRSLAQAKNPLADSEDEELLAHDNQSSLGSSVGSSATSAASSSIASSSLGSSQDPALRLTSTSDKLRDSASSGDGFSLRITAVAGRDLASKDSNGISLSLHLSISPSPFINLIRIVLRAIVVGWNDA